MLKKEKGRPTSTSTTHDCSESADSVKVSLTRSQVSRFNREQCFYCQDFKRDKKHARSGSNPEKVHLCRSSHIGKSIQKIIDVSQNVQWKLNMADILAEGDFLSRDIRLPRTVLEALCAAGPKDQ